MRAPTPTAVMQAARRSDPPAQPTTPPAGTPIGPQVVQIKDASESTPAPSLPPPSKHPAEAQAEAYRRRAAAAEKALLARKESEPVAPPKTEPAASGLVSDETIGRLVREVVNALAKKVGAPAALIVLIGGGAAGFKVATDKPAPPALTLEQLDDRLGKLKTRKGGLDDIARGQNGSIKLLKCLRKKQNQIGESMLPAPDHAGAARRIAPYDDDCGDPPSLLPDPDQ